MSDAEFERRLRRAFNAPVPARAQARDAIMVRVRQVARQEQGRRMIPPSFSRMARHSIAGVALAAGIGSITTLSTMMPLSARRHQGSSATSEVIGDTVVGRLKDTLRLVRLIFDDSAARRVAVVGDFNGWGRTEANAMRRDSGTGRWETQIALSDGNHRYAIVVDNTRWVGDSASRQAGTPGHVYSLLHVARASN